jgi:hypothetical protein
MLSAPKPRLTPSVVRMMAFLKEVVNDTEAYKHFCRRLTDPDQLLIASETKALTRLREEGFLEGYPQATPRLTEAGLSWLRAYHEREKEKASSKKKYKPR